MSCANICQLDQFCKMPARGHPRITWFSTTMCAFKGSGSLRCCAAEALFLECFRRSSSLMLDQHNFHLRLFALRKIAHLQQRKTEKPTWQFSVCSLHLRLINFEQSEEKLPRSRCLKIIEKSLIWHCGRIELCTFHILSGHKSWCEKGSSMASFWQLDLKLVVK